MISNMKIVSKNNINVYYNLAQAYEAEFSILTNKLPKADGLYSLDTQINYEDIIGYIYYHNNVPIGVTAIRIGQDENEVMEYYIIPNMRRRGHGLEFLHKIFVKHKGKWIVKQINGATSARGFWISTLEKLKIKYMEDVYEDKYWGVVNRQIFHYK